MISEHEKAIIDFDNVIQKNPKNAHAYFRRAFSHKAVKVILIVIDITNIRITNKQLKILSRLSLSIHTILNSLSTIRN